MKAKYNERPLGRSPLVHLLSECDELAELILLGANVVPNLGMMIQQFLSCLNIPGQTTYKEKAYRRSIFYRTLGHA
jgi:hypothetical protein